MRSRTLVLVSGLAVSLAAASGLAAPTVVDTGRMQARNGIMVGFIASVDGERELMHYTLPDGRTLDAGEFRAWEEANPRPIIDQDLLDRSLSAAKVGDTQTRISVTVALKSNPFPRLMRMAREALADEFADLKAKADQIAREQFPDGVLSPEAHEGLNNHVARGLFALTPDQRRRLTSISERHEALEKALREQVFKATLPLVQDDQNALVAAATALGASIESRLMLLNGASLSIPLARLSDLAALPIVARVFENPVGKKELSITVPSLGVPAGFWANSFDGGIWDAGTFDSGAQQDHPDIDHLTFLRAPTVGLTDTDGHGTSVCSIIASNDPTNRGLAFGISTFLLGFPSSFTSHANWMYVTASDDADVMNMSWSLGGPPFEYGDFEQFVDGMVDDTNNSFVKSCGNEGPGDNTLTRPGNAYNGISTANMSFFGTQSRADDNITGGSSRGPTTSGRRKPDLAAPGQGVQAANNLWATQADFVGFGGTSAAAPHVTGGLLLLADAGYSSPLSARAILVNTADAFTDAGTVTGTDDNLITGSEWNKVYGWGYINLGRAYTARAAVFTGTVDDGITPVGPDYKLFRGTMAAGGKATLTWNRHVGWNGASFPTAIQTLSNLNLFAYRATDGTTVDSSTTSINNIEQVGTVAAAGDVILKIDTFGALDPDVATENYALATPPGFVEVGAPALAISAPTPAVFPGQEFSFRVTVNNTGGSPAQNVNLSLSLPAGWSLTSGASFVDLGTIAGGGLDGNTFSVRAPCTAVGTATLNYSVSSSSYGESFSDAGSSLLTVNALAPALVQDVVVDSTVLARAYPFTVNNADFNVVATSIGSGTADIDVQLDTNLCTDGVEASSLSGGTARDFVVANGNNAAVATGVSNWAQVTRFSGVVTDYSVELDRGFDVSYGSARVEPFVADEIIEVMEVNVPASAVGKTQRLTANVTAGLIDPHIFLFQPNTAYAGRSGASLNRNTGGPGVSERANFIPGVAGVWGVVILNTNAVAGTVQFRLGCIADFDGSGTRDVADIFAFLSAWFAGTPEADIDLSGVRDVADIFSFLSFWFAGC